MYKECYVILRKILRVVESLPLTADDMYSKRSAHGTFANILQELCTNQDYDVRTKAAMLLKKFPVTACQDPHLLQQLGGCTCCLGWQVAHKPIAFPAAAAAARL
eukprot:scaffold209016_cov22-Tisochrysis_lutea.AAC.1